MGKGKIRNIVNNKGYQLTENCAFQLKSIPAYYTFVSNNKQKSILFRVSTYQIKDEYFEANMN